MRRVTGGMGADGNEQRGDPHHRRDRPSADAEAATADRDLVGDVYRRLDRAGRGANRCRHHRRRRGAGALFAEGLCGADRDLAEAAPRRRQSHRYPSPLAHHAARSFRTRRRHAVRGDLRGGHRPVGHPRQGGRPADSSPARRHGPHGSARLCGFRELGQRRVHGP